MLKLKVKIPFYQNKISLKCLYLVIICNLTHLQDGKTKVEFMLRILEKIVYDPKQDLDPKPTEN
jgi:hypothetical protein